MRKSTKDQILFPVAPLPESPCELVAVGRVQADPGQAFKNKSHPCFTFEYVLSGKGVVKIGDDEEEVSSGDLYFLPQGIPNDYHASLEDPWRKFFFNIRGNLIPSLLKSYQLNFKHVIRGIGDQVKPCFETMMFVCENSNEDAHHLAAIQLHQLLCTAWSHQNKLTCEYSSEMISAQRFIESYLENTFTLQDLCDFLSRSRTHTIRTFKSATGLTPYDYLLKRRIERSKLYLMNTNMSIREISQRLDFADEYYFSNFFKKKVGKSPKNFRKMNG
jgi:AraC family transcriptional regulator, arabinose operon regulatory protein